MESDYGSSFSQLARYLLLLRIHDDNRHRAASDQWLANAPYLASDRKLPVGDRVE